MAAYNGEAIVWSDRYQAYTWLLISNASQPQVKEEAAGKVTLITADKKTLTETCDINGTNLVDINDAQLVYNMYNAMYDNFTDVDMENFLKADVTGDKTVNVNDARAVVAEVVKSK